MVGTYCFLFFRSFTFPFLLVLLGMPAVPLLWNPSTEAAPRGLRGGSLHLRARLRRPLGALPGVESTQRGTLRTFLDGGQRGLEKEKGRKEFEECFVCLFFSLMFFPQTASADGVLNSCKETDFVPT